MQVALADGDLIGMAAHAGYGLDVATFTHRSENGRPHRLRESAVGAQILPITERTKLLPDFCHGLPPLTLSAFESNLSRRPDSREAKWSWMFRQNRFNYSAEAQALSTSRELYRR